MDLPDVYSRLGHREQSYRISQWYPKVSMLGDSGWLAYPYLDMGEFFSPFATYHVEVTLPANYIVAGTGELSSPGEKAWIDSLAAEETMPLAEYPRSATEVKTVIFDASSVHDFAWFADKRFAVRKQLAQVGDKQIECYVYFQNKNHDVWSKAPGYIARALEFFSERVGQYPYSHASVVEAAGDAIGGMEYPMITLIGSTSSSVWLDQLIAHEVGHNWFYGILATDERRYPWMDEGLTTFFEDQYMKLHYGMRGDQMIPYLMIGDNALSDPQYVVANLFRKGRLSRTGADPTEQPEWDYLANAYFKPGLSFHMLESYVGTKVFADAVRDYYDQWKFKHPGPDDLQRVIEEHCGCNLKWFFSDLMESDQLPDYRIASYDVENGTIEIENNGGIHTPVQLLAYSNGSLVDSSWVFDTARVWRDTLDCSTCDRVEVFDRTYSLDATPDDNVKYIGRKSTRTPFRFGLPGRKTEPGVNKIGIFPAAGWNKYDGGMLGVYLSNLRWPVSNFNWTLIPMYAIGSKSLSGIADVAYKRYPATGGTGFWEVGLEARTFHYNKDDHYGFIDQYTKLSPRFTFVIGRDDRPPYVTHQLQYRYIYLRQNYGQGIDFDERIWSEETRVYHINEVTYLFKSDHVIKPMSLEVQASQGKGFVRLTTDFDWKLMYNSKKKSFYIHGFAGWLPYYEDPDANVNLYYNGISSTSFFATDYAHDEFLFGRNESTGFLSQQVFTKDARLRTLYSGGVGTDWMLSLGLAADLPLPVPLRAYVDFAVSPDIFDEGTRIDYSSGIALILVNNAIEVYFPLFESSAITNSLTYSERPGYFQRVTFLFDLNKFKPRDRVDGLLGL